MVAVAFGLGLSVLALDDGRRGKVPVRPAQYLSALTVIGLGLVGVASSSWGRLTEAALGAALVTVIQLVPYRLQARSDRGWIGRADVRLGIPFGWTLGWFGLGFTVVGFLAALASGLMAALASRRPTIPFVPFLSFGFWLALLWAGVRA